MRGVVHEQRAPRGNVPTFNKGRRASSVDLTGLRPVNSTLDPKSAAAGVLSTYTVDNSPVARAPSLIALFLDLSEALA
jgi:hypothetical protein